MVVEAPPEPRTETEAGVIEDARARQRRHRMIGLILFVLAAAIAALIFGLDSGGGGTGGTGRASPARPSGSRAVSATAVPTFVGGMRGQLATSWSGFSGTTGFIWLVQTTGCEGECGDRHGWLASTTNGGVSWRVTPQRHSIAPPVWEGEDGWSATLGNGRGGFIATHDGGRTWTTVRVPRSPRPGAVSVANGTVWATAERCRGPYRCVYPVLRGPVSGSRLTAVPATPSDRGDLQIIAVNASSAYLFTPTADAGVRQAWVTHDGGHTWQTVARGCRENIDTTYPTASDSHGTIWRYCAPTDGRQKLAISSDGGGRWVYRPAPSQITNLYPESARIAWAQAWSGTTLRTDDGGRSWHPVWTLNKNLTPAYDAFGHGATLTPRSATAATVVMLVTHTDRREHRTLTNLLTYRTTDGGAHWQRIPVALPRGS